MKTYLFAQALLLLFRPLKLDSIQYWTHKEALDVKELPQSLAIIGGGVIGMEFASLFNSLGVEVTVIERMSELLGSMDKELTARLREEYEKRKLTYLLDTEVTAVNAIEEDKIQVHYKQGDEENSLTASQLLLSVGRKPQLAKLGLDRLNFKRTNRGFIEVNKQLQSSYANIYICGDANGKSLLAHTAIREAEVAIHTILSKPDEMSYRAIPSVIYTNPEFAGVGETEESLQEQNVNYKKVAIPLAYSGRFTAENERVNGICKLLFSEDKTLIGAHVLGNPASEIITLAGMPIELKLKAEEWGKIIFPHPTVGEILKHSNNRQLIE